MLSVALLCMNSIFAQGRYKAEFTDQNKDGIYIVEVSFDNHRVSLFRKVEGEADKFLFYSTFENMVVNQNNSIGAKFLMYDNAFPAVEDRGRQVYVIFDRHDVYCNDAKDYNDQFILSPVNTDKYNHFLENLYAEISGSSVNEGGTGSNTASTTTTVPETSSDVIIVPFNTTSCDNSGKLIGQNNNSNANDNSTSTSTRPVTNTTPAESPLDKLKREAENGDLDSQKELARKYLIGDGVAENKEEAVKWAKMAAEQGDKDSQYLVGTIYYSEGKKPADDKEAFKWFEKAANQNHPDAQLYMAECYYYGYGTSRNASKAVEYYKKASNNGFAEAMFSLGWCYEQGDGVARNMTEAKKWYRKAKENGSVNATQRLQQLGE